MFSRGVAARDRSNAANGPHPTKDGHGLKGRRQGRLPCMTLTENIRRTARPTVPPVKVQSPSSRCFKHELPPNHQGNSP